MEPSSLRVDEALAKYIRRGFSGLVISGVCDEKLFQTIRF
jgi:hypothetical protein